MVKVLLMIGGFIHLLLAVSHIALGKALKWPESISCLDAMNEGMIQIFNINIVFIMLIIFIASIFFYKDLVSTKLGNAILIAIATHALLRATNEIIFFGTKELPSIILVSVCIIIAILYLLPLFSAKAPTGNEPGHMED
jgi:hypothetical protein